MKDFFLYRPFFRLLSPILIGGMAYLLILLLNNNVAQLEAEFLGAELYFSCGIALLVQESSRLILLRLPVWLAKSSSFWRILGIAFGAFLGSVLVTVVAVFIYYDWALGYRPEMAEWGMFAGVFGFFTIIQLSLYLSYYFLAQANERHLAEENQRKANLIADFNQFKRGINPELLFESLESLIVCLHEDREAADDLLDQLSTVYRYILGGKAKELVPIAEELEVLEELLALFRQLPYREMELQPTSSLKGWLVPGSLLVLVEHIMRNSIVFPNQVIALTLSASDTHFLLEYQAAEKIEAQQNTDDLESLRQRYSIYSSTHLITETSSKIKVLGVPILHLN